MSASDSSSSNATHARPLVIVGAGGHAVSVANVALAAGFTIEAFVDQGRQGSTLCGFRVVADMGTLGDPARFSLAIAVGDNAAREKVWRELAARVPEPVFPALIHPTALVSFFCEVAQGTVVMPHAVIGPNSRVGSFCLINTRASIDHDCVMKDFSSLAPAAVTGGTVRIGRRSAVSIGATIRHGVTIGDDSVLGANSYLNRDLPDRQVAYGTPARLIRMRETGDPYLG